MARLTSQEITEHKAWLSKWQSPADMIGYVDHVMDYVGSQDLFTQAGIDFLTEAWAAATIARCICADNVRLELGEFPDFEVAVAQEVRQFEFAEADLEERRRGDEYRCSVGVLEDDPVEDWVARAERAPAELRRVAQKKADKGYPKDSRLLIYLNIDEFGIRQREIELMMAPATSVARNSFKEVWVLWKRQAYKVWEEGRRAVLIT